MYFAHSGNDSDRNDGQTLREHLANVAGLAGEAAAVFGSVKAILEHRFAIEAHEGGRDREQADKLKLATENWAGPVVVTTNVQFFESLFAARTSTSRKVHNIANSVIILDEAQTLPTLDERNFKTGHAAGLKLEGRELASDPEGLAAALRRDIVRRCGELSNDDLIEALRVTPQGLTGSSMSMRRARCPSHRGMDRNIKLAAVARLLPHVTAQA